MQDFLRRAQAALPRGHALSDEAWRQRHGNFVTLLWLHVVGLFVFALVRGFDVTHALFEVAIIAAFAILGSASTQRKELSSVIVTSGLLSSSAVLVHLSGGTIEAHFHFFVIMTLIPLYQSWTPFLLGILYVVVHHGLMGWLDPDSVYNHPAAIANPFKWALVHGGFILGASVAGLIVWKRNEDLREKVEGLQILELKQRSARDLNDSVVQSLAVAKMASQMGDHAAVDRAIESTLASARSIVSDLLPAAPTAGEFRRVIDHEAAQAAAIHLERVEAEAAGKTSERVKEAP